MVKKLSKPGEVVSEFKREVKTLIISAFSFITALAWNNAIQSIIKTYIPAENNWFYLLGNAVLITFIAVLVTIFLTRKYD